MEDQRQRVAEHRQQLAAQLHQNRDCLRQAVRQQVHQLHEHRLNGGPAVDDRVEEGRQHGSELRASIGQEVRPYTLDALDAVGVRACRAGDVLLRVAGLRQDRVPADLHLRGFVQGVELVGDPHLEHGLLDGRIVQNDAHAFQALGLAHQAAAQLVEGVLVGQIVEAGKVIGQAGHHFRHDGRVLRTHADAREDRTAVGQEALHFVFAAVRSGREVLGPGVCGVRSAFEYGLKLGVCFFRIGCGVNGCAAELLDRFDAFLDDGKARGSCRHLFQNADQVFTCARALLAHIIQPAAGIVCLGTQAPGVFLRAVQSLAQRGLDGLDRVLEGVPDVRRHAFGRRPHALEFRLNIGDGGPQAGAQRLRKAVALLDALQHGAAHAGAHFRARAGHIVKSSGGAGADVGQAGADLLQLVGGLLGFFLRLPLLFV